MAENNHLPQVTAMVPCRNEEKFISKCLQSIIDNDYPKDKLEVFLIDGASEDKTREIAKNYAEQHSFIKILDNPKKITPAALNIGIKNSKGEIVIKMDAHTVYEKDYISKCVKRLIESGVDNVGGVLENFPAKDNLFAKAIAICLSHPFGAGTSYFRTGVKEPKEVDTVAFGCYWKKIFDKIGLFNETMAKIEDLELNFRLRKAGGKIMLFPDIKAFYYPSSDNLKDFFIHNFEDGIWTTYPLRFGFRIFSLRHLIPLFFVSAIIFSFVFSPFFWQARFIFGLVFGSYLLTNLFFSFKISLRERDFRYLFSIPIAFACRHFAYGLGSVWGLIK